MTIASPTPESVSAKTSHGGGRDLAAALQEEKALLETLIDVLEQQRRGIAQHDLEVVDETVQGSQRILLTLGEARKRRRQLVRIVSGVDKEEETPDLTKIDPKARDAWDSLQQAARTALGYASGEPIGSQGGDPLRRGVRADRLSGADRGLGRI